MTLHPLCLEFELGKQVNEHYIYTFKREIINDGSTNHDKVVQLVGGRYMLMKTFHWAIAVETEYQF